MLKQYSKSDVYERETDLDIPVNKLNVNTTKSYVQLEMIRILNKSSIERSVHSELKKLILQENGNVGPAFFSILSDEQKCEIKSFFHESNALLKEKYGIDLL